VNLRQALSYYRWPLYLGGILAMAVVAQGVLVYVATRPDAPRPIRDYYQKSLEWDADAAVLAASRQLGWTVRFDLPTDTPHTPGMPRPVDVIVADRDGAPVGQLSGQLQALRPADDRLGQAADLTAIPHRAGTYRTLLRLDQPGLWILRLDLRQGAGSQSSGSQGGRAPDSESGRLRFVHSARVSLTASGLAE